MTTHRPPSERTTIRRGAENGSYDPADIRSVLKAGLVAHVGVTTDQGPIVLPMAYGVRDDEILVHGGVANAMMRAARNADVCITVTILDGFVVARTPLENSMNYRSVVIRGAARRIDDPLEKAAALKVINDHIAPSWDTAREPTDDEITITQVLSVPLVEASVKIRKGDPIDGPDDVGRRHWAGIVPLLTTWGTPTPSSDLTADIVVPAAIAALADTNAHPVLR